MGLVVTTFLLLTQVTSTVKTGANTRDTGVSPCVNKEWKKSNFGVLISSSQVPRATSGLGFTCCGHACDVEILLPLLLDPLKGEGITDLVALLCIPGALAHHHQGTAMAAACSS